MRRVILSRFDKNQYLFLRRPHRTQSADRPPWLALRSCLGADSQVIIDVSSRGNNSTIVWRMQVDQFIFLDGRHRRNSYKSGPTPHTNFNPQLARALGSSPLFVPSLTEQCNTHVVTSNGANGGWRFGKGGREIVTSAVSLTLTMEHKYQSQLRVASPCFH